MVIPTLRYEQALWNSGLSQVAGIDEVGRGALAGPVVTALVIFDKTHQPITGVRDSKTLSHLQRQKLEKQILGSAAFYSITECSAAEIDQLGILSATIMSMQRAIMNCSSLDHVLIDGLPFPKDPLSQYKKTFIVKGDQLSYSIAAASIIAKEYRDRVMREHSWLLPQYGFEKHVGYGTAAHRLAIRQFGLSDLHRRSFCTHFTQS